MLLGGLHQAQSAWGRPWAGRAVTCPGADPGPVACPDLPPAGSCSWGMAAALLDGARPSQNQVMDGGTYRGAAGTAAVWAGRDVWILPGLLRPCSQLHLHFLPVTLDGATCLLRCLHPLVSWKRAKERGDTSGSTQPGSCWEQNWEPFPAPPSPGCPVPPSAQVGAGGSPTLPVSRGQHIAPSQPLPPRAPPQLPAPTFWALSLTPTGT